MSNHKMKKGEAVLVLAAFILDLEVRHPDKYVIDYGGGRTELLSDIYARDPEQLKRRVRKREEVYRKLGMEVPDVN